MAMLTRYEPFREMVSLRDVMDQLLQGALVAPGTMVGQPGGVAPPMDVRETEDAYEVGVSLSGWRPEEIAVTIQQDTITIGGQKVEESEEGEPERGRYHVRERSFASFTRSFMFPTPVDADGVEARFENGELVVRLPKAESARPRRIGIGGGGRSRLSSGDGRSGSRQTDEGRTQSGPRQEATSPAGGRAKRSGSRREASTQRGDGREKASAGSSG
jgi:HSP20 family protein